MYGEEEWKVRQHGYSKRRTWQKLHLGVDESTGAIEAVSADGAYDKRKCYDAIAKQDAHAQIPPREDAQYWDQDGETHARNPTLNRIEAVGRAE